MYDFLVGAASIGLLMAGWYLLQVWIRGHTADLPPDCDYLEGRWGCVGCLLHGKCRHEKVGTDESKVLSEVVNADSEA